MALIVSLNEGLII